MKISVALAAYKGEKYIAGQIDSILSQLGADDELIVSDDYPSGKTKAIVEGFAAKDGRVKYLEGKGKGVVKNFENALNACSGDVIFLCDQDDVWMPDKVKTVMAEFENGAQLVMHDASITDADLNVTNPSCFSVHGANPKWRIHAHSRAYRRSGSGSHATRERRSHGNESRAHKGSLYRRCR